MAINYLKQITDYFGVERASQITWAHAVNNKAYLQQCLTSSAQTMMLETDVMFSSKLKHTIIMAHPKIVYQNSEEYIDFNVESDLTFDEFMEAVLSFNQRESKHKKGVKLDFKMPSVVSECICVSFLFQSIEEKRVQKTHSLFVETQRKFS
jgi:hypothetical protein